jgi:hypothetical protein
MQQNTAQSERQRSPAHSAKLNYYVQVTIRLTSTVKPQAFNIRLKTRRFLVLFTSLLCMITADSGLFELAALFICTSNGNLDYCSIIPYFTKYLVAYTIS